VLTTVVGATARVDEAGIEVPLTLVLLASAVGRKFAGITFEAL
jgi:hypothetical protein